MGTALNEFKGTALNEFKGTAFKGTAFKGTAFKIAQTYQNSTEPYKDAQVIHTSRLLPYISPQPEGIS
jgi:hypothetical protein